MSIRVGRRALDVERLALHRIEQERDCPGGADRAIKRRRKDWATVDWHDVMGLRGCKADTENIVTAPPCVKRRAAASSAMRIDQVADVAFKINLLQSGDHEPALPRAVGRGLPVLHRATAACTEMLTNWRDARVARGDHAEEMPPIRMARPRLGLHRFAGKGIGHIDWLVRAIGDAIAAVTETGDPKLFRS